MQYDLVFEGGGAKGMAFVGALQAFTERGHTPGRLLGTSAGAITATFLAAGYDVDEMSAALDETTPDGVPIFATFLAEPAPFDEEMLQKSAMKAFLSRIDVPILPEFMEQKLDDALLRFMAATPHLRNLFNFIERGGWFAADSFLNWMQKHLDSGKDHGAARRYGAMTLSEMFAATGRSLTLVAADTTDSRILILNHITAPDCPVIWAARMSMSVPLLWEEVIWQREWGTYREQDITAHTVVDGGLLSNFPIELFISHEPYVTAVMGNEAAEAVLGFLIDEKLPVTEAPPSRSRSSTASSLTELQTAQRLRRLINTVLQAHDKEVISAFEQFVVRLPAKGYGTTEFKMEKPRRQALINTGRRVTAAYLDQLAQMPAYSAQALSVEEIAAQYAQRLLAE